MARDLYCRFLSRRFSSFELVSLVATVCDGVFTSKTAELAITTDGFGVLLPVPNRLACWINDPRLLSIVYMMGFDFVLAYVAIHCG